MTKPSGTPQNALQSIQDNRRSGPWVGSEPVHSALYSAGWPHSFFGSSPLSEIVIREIERRIALHLNTELLRTVAHYGRFEGCPMDIHSPLRRRRVTAAFFAISAETEQPYRITEDCDLWAIMTEAEEDVPVSVYLDEQHELLVERYTFFASTKPFSSN